MAVQKTEIEKIVGKDNVLDDATTLQTYSQDQSFVAPRSPDMVVFVQTVPQIQDIIKLANKTLTPVIPYSSGMNLHGAAIPDQGGIILNMSRMKKIIEVDEKNWFVLIEPGVTYRELDEAMSAKGFRFQMPFGVVPERSVLSSYLERDPVITAPSFERGNALIMDTEVILPNGELFRTGNWASGGSPGSPNGPIRNCLYRMWTAAQGTLGVITKMGIQIEPMPKAQKLFFLPFQNLIDAIEPLKRIQKKEIGTECLLLNSFNLAALANRSWNIPDSFPAEPVEAVDFDHMRQEIPPWTMIICINGGARRTEEKISYETEALKELCDVLNIEILEGLPNVPGLESTIRAEMLRPWSILKKFNYKGSVHDLTFKTSINNVAQLAYTFQELAQKHGYPAADIGMYLMPLERGRAIHCEFDLHCTSTDTTAQEQTKALWLEASSRLLNDGGYFDRPYGAWAPLIYERAANYAQMLKKLKAETDPNNILNPGKLCFS